MTPMGGMRKPATMSAAEMHDSMAARVLVFIFFISHGLDGLDGLERINTDFFAC